MPGFLCIEIPEVPSPADLEIMLPGGIAVRPSIPPSQIRNSVDLAMNVLAQAQPALAAFQPVLDLIGVLEALTTCMKAIPDAITTLDPKKITDCLGGLTESMAKIAQYLPQLCLPIGIMKMIGLIVYVLEDTKAALIALQAAMDKAAGAIEHGTTTGNATLIQIGQCAQAQAAREIEKQRSVLEMVGAPIRLINVVLALVGQPCLKLDLDPSMDLDGLIGAISAILAFMKSISIPIPDLPAKSSMCSSFVVYNPTTGNVELED